MDLPRPFRRRSQGQVFVVLDGAILGTPLLGEGVDQKAGWSELLREAADAAAGDLLASGGAKCSVAQICEFAEQVEFPGAFQLRSEARTWIMLVADEVHVTRAA